jgi:DNA polymerase III epsilon subunit-like protein
MAIIVVVDTETTGLGRFDGRGARPDAVVQVGLAWRPKGEGVQVWERVCNPGPKFVEGGRADEALKISGLTLEQVLSAPSAESIGRELRSVLARIRRSEGEVDLRAFNVEFDKVFLSVEPWTIRTGWGPCLTRVWTSGPNY